MNIAILGANPVGAGLAENLVNEKNAITLIDNDEVLLESLREKFDILTVVGNPSNPEILERAKLDNIDMLLAVTDTDEINMVACLVARKIFNVPTRICRLRSSGYLQHPELFELQKHDNDIIIHPEQIITSAIVQLLNYPGTLQVSDFAGGKVVLVALEVDNNSPFSGHRLNTLPQHCPPGIDGRVAAIYRAGKPIIPQGDTVIAAGDEVFFIAARDAIGPLISALHSPLPPCKRLMLAGGGNIGFRLAQAVEHLYRVTIIEPQKARCQFLSTHLDRSLIIHGSATEQQLLNEQGIERTDMFCSLTNLDSVNMLSSMLAAREGAGNVVALINDPTFVDLAHSNKINIPLSPRQFTISSILSHIRRGEVTQAVSLRRGAAEVLEIVLHGTDQNSKIVGHRIDELPLPDSATVGTIIRGDEVIVPHRDTILQDNDHIILFVADKRQIADVESLFLAAFDHF